MRCESTYTKVRILQRNERSRRNQNDISYVTYVTQPNGKAKLKMACEHVVFMTVEIRAWELNTKVQSILQISLAYKQIQHYALNSTNLTLG